ncbi:hypothetical protein [Streptomyces canus]|uniref:hypothetical protein n=1 Tax=Streptomyces canus TaxID=58343 RepID=UPI000AC1DB85|nr:hypothetical protein [Streptomyces canus]
MSETPAKKTAKKAASKRISALRRPEGNGALLNNPALSGVKETVSRSYIGGGQGVIPGPSTSDDAPSASGAATPDSRDTAADAAVAPTTDSSELASKAPESELPEIPGDRSTTPDSTPEPASDIADAPAGPQSTTATSQLVRSEEPQVAAEANGAVTGPDQGTQLTPASDHSANADVEDGDDDHTDEANDAKQADAKKRSATPRGRRRQTAQQILEKSYTESVIDLRLRKKEWAAHPFRFTPDQITQMNKRAAEDSAATGLSLTSAQYVNAAMAMHLPATLEEQLDLAEAFLRDMGARRIPEGQQSSYRVSPEVLDIVRPLSNHLKAAGKARTGYHIYSAVLARYLQDLASEGPLTFES